jgi:hypothetical protein
LPAPRGRNSVPLVQRIALACCVLGLTVAVFWLWLAPPRFTLRTVTLHSKEEFVLKLDERTGDTWLLFQFGPKAGWVPLTNVSPDYFAAP